MENTVLMSFTKCCLSDSEDTKVELDMDFKKEGEVHGDL